MQCTGWCAVHWLACSTLTGVQYTDWLRVFLQVLDVSKSPVTDEGMAALLSCDQLEDLNLAGSQITDDGLHRILGRGRGGAGLVALRELDISSCRGVERAARQAAAQGLPQLRNHLGGGGGGCTGKGAGGEGERRSARSLAGRNRLDSGSSAPLPAPSGTKAVEGVPAKANMAGGRRARRKVEAEVGEEEPCEKRRGRRAEGRRKGGESDGDTGGEAQAGAGAGRRAGPGPGPAQQQPRRSAKAQAARAGAGRTRGGAAETAAEEESAAHAGGGGGSRAGRRSGGGRVVAAPQPSGSETTSGTEGGEEEEAGEVGIGWRAGRLRDRQAAPLGCPPRSRYSARVRTPKKHFPVDELQVVESEDGSSSGEGS